MNLKRHFIAFTVAACALPGAASALQPSAPQSSGGLNQGLGYNYLGGQIGYGDTDPDGPADFDGFAFNVEGSGDVIRHVNILGHYNHTFGGHADTDMFSIGGGYHTDLNINSPVRLDVFGNVTFEYINFDLDHGGNHDNAGVGVRGGVRAKFNPRFEADSSIGYVDYGPQDGPVFQIGGVYDMTKRIGLRANFRHYSLDDLDIDQFLAGVRYYFD